MGVMRQAGILESVRGRAGGYRLAKPADEIGLGSLLLVLGEPLFEETDYCQKHAGSEAPHGVCLNHSTCTLKSLWQTLEHWLRRTLDEISLADLIQHERRLPELLRERLAAAMLEEEPQLLSLNIK
jgi:Rrf2 family iron-sulfur cluster assembly transcriptional regulator